MKFIYSKFRKKVASIALLLIFVAVSLSSACTSFKREDHIRIRRNGYTDVVVAIRDDVEENVELIERIKEVFADASELLFNATKKRLYFREITIVIPSTWKLENYYDDYNVENYDGILQNATWESYDRADFCVENRDLFTIDTPFVSNYATDCGETTASYINLTPEYLLDKVRANRLFGPYSNVLVHNWAQFRYGVFSEHANRDLVSSSTTSTKGEFYMNSRGEIEATRCSLKLTGRIRGVREGEPCHVHDINGVPSMNECVFDDDTKPPLSDSSSQLSIGSLLYKPSLIHLNEFCDNNTQNSHVLHNREAPNLQNRECKGQSVWEVMRNHNDFKDFVSMPNYLLKSVVPKFQILKNRIRKVVLLIDKSLRIQPETKYMKIEKALKEYAKYILDDNVLIGIVHFDSFAKITLPMTRVKDSPTRKRIKEIITPPLPNNKRSNIWNAISLGVSLLRTTMNPMDKISITGGNMIIITSSNLDQNYPNYPSQNETIMRNDIRLDLIRINEQNDDFFDEYVRSTGGLSFTLKDSNPYLDLENVLGFLSNRDSMHGKQSVELVNKNYEFSSSLPILGSLHVDETLSRPGAVLKIVFNIEHISEYLEINVYEPTSKKHPSKYNLKCKDSSLSSLIPRTDLANIQDVVCEFRRPLVGKWTYEIVNRFAQKSARVSVKAYVYFHQYADESNYYLNYYDRDDYRSKKRRYADHLDDEEDHEHDRPISADFGASALRIEAKWQRTRVQWPSDADTTPQKLFVSLSKGLKPILNATVKAFIHRPSGDVIELNLYDNGLFADRFRNDGIYSRYFSNFNQDGNYFAIVEITSNQNTKVHMQKLVGMGDLEFYPNIGVVHKFDDEESIRTLERIQRSVIAGYFRLTGYKPDKDIDQIKPSRVNDFRVVDVDYAKKLVKLSFTAPGDNFDLGRVAHYDIKCSHDYEYLSEYEGEVNGNEDINDENNKLVRNLTITSASFINQYPSTTADDQSQQQARQHQPNQAGFVETLTLDLTRHEEDDNDESSNEEKHHLLTACKIRSIDSNNNTSPWSPILTIRLDKQVQYAPELRLYRGGGGGAGAAGHGDDLANHSSAVEEALRSVEQKESLYSRFFIGFLVFLGLIFIAQIGMIIALTIHKLRDRRYEEIKPVRV